MASICADPERNEASLSIFDANAAKEAALLRIDLTEDAKQQELGQRIERSAASAED